MKRVICLIANHKWARLRTAAGNLTEEEAYNCRRCGKLHYGKPGRDMPPVLDSSGSGGNVPG